MKPEELLYENKNRFSEIDDKERKEVFSFCEDYKKFITKAKTEREFTSDAARALESAGFVHLDAKSELKPGDKVYDVNRGKGLVAAVIGKEDIELGVNVIGAHVDAPRLDFKPNPLYEDGHMAYFKTHYYGGIKKYQWTTIPLAIHGIVALQDGTQIPICIGEDEDDPVFVITDLLPHLAQDQMQKKASEFIAGESLNLVAGNIESDDKDAKEKVKYNILKALNEKYDIVEEDFVSAEIEVVPAFKARDLGIDRSMIAAYGQDDRVCAYTALRAILDVKKPDKTAVCLLVDKEEVGSMGNTGMQSKNFENVMAKIVAKLSPSYSELNLRETIANSTCLSADVSSALDPNFAEVSEKRNSAVVNGGIALTKYTGSRGKGGANDASAELMASVRRIFNENNVKWQVCELGKVDCGGGGTIAQFVANMGMEVVDCGVALLSMHAPYEVAGKLDVYMAYKGYKAFFEKN